MSLFWRFPVSYSVYRLGRYIALHTLDEFVPFGLRLMDWGANCWRTPSGITLQLSGCRRQSA